MLDVHWFSISHDEKQAHMKKVHICKVNISQSPVNSLMPPPTSLLSVQVQEVNLKANSESTLSGIWKTAEKILGSKAEYLVEVPWISDKKARLVKSFSSPHPHLVVQQDSKGHIYQCHKNCEMFKGFRMCSHTIAVAEINGELKSFLEVLTNTTPNLTTIAMQGLPAGSGRKGGQEKHRKMKKETVLTRSVRQCMSCSYSAALSDAQISEQQETVATNSGYLPITSSVVNSTSSLSTSPSNYFVSSVGTEASTNPFILKLKTKQIKVCQSCRSNFEGPNDTLGMVTIDRLLFF